MQTSGKRDGKLHLFLFALLLALLLELLLLSFCENAARGINFVVTTLGCLLLARLLLALALALLLWHGKLIIHCSFLRGLGA